VLAEAGLAAADVTILATVDRRAGEHAVRELALDRGWLLAALPVAELARQQVPHPSVTVAAAVGTPSVAEAAALRAAGAGSELIVPKRGFPRVTVAVARGVPTATTCGRPPRALRQQQGRNATGVAGTGTTPGQAAG
jgi:cobalt-precorrin 5A hydrolase